MAQIIRRYKLIAVLVIAVAIILLFKETGATLVVLAALVYAIVVVVRMVQNVGRKVAEIVRGDRKSKQSIEQSYHSKNVSPQRTKSQEPDYSESSSVALTVTYNGVMEEASPAGTIPWIASPTRIRAGKFELSTDMVYFVRKTKSGMSEPSLINGAQPTRAQAPEDLGYWPSYANMSSDQRHRYLCWLETGRSEQTVDIGYVFVFFYGLERRALVDQKSIPEVFAEVLRLRRLYGANRSFDGYSRRFLLLLMVRHADKISTEMVDELISTLSRLDDDAINILLSHYASREGTLAAPLVHCIVRWLPAAKRGVVLQRAPNELRLMFEKRFSEHWPNGLSLRFSKRLSTYEYHPASILLSRLNQRDLPNPMGLRSQFKPIVDLWNNCIEELKSYSRAIRKTGDASSAEAFDALPEELRAEREHPLSKDVAAVIGEVKAHGITTVFAGKVARAIGIEDRDKLTLGQSRSLSKTLEAIGFKVEPDAQLSGVAYKWVDPIAVFQDDSSEITRQESFQPAALMLQLGVYIAEADGQLAKQELDLIKANLQAGMHLNDAERRRLEVLQSLLLERGSDLTGLSRRLRALLSHDQRLLVGRYLVAIAAADSKITIEELKALRKSYRALDLDSDELETVIGKVVEESLGETVVVRKARQRRKGEPISKPERESQEPVIVELDSEKLSLIEKETAEVQKVLAAALAQEEDEVDAKELQEVDVLLPSTQGHDLGHGEKMFLNHLLGREVWSRNELKAWARSHGLILGGLIEAINEWSQDSYGDWLIDDGEEEIQVAKEIMMEKSQT